MLSRNIWVGVLIKLFWKRLTKIFIHNAKLPVNCWWVNMKSIYIGSKKKKERNFKTLWGTHVQVMTVWNKLIMVSFKYLLERKEKRQWNSTTLWNISFWWYFWAVLVRNFPGIFLTIEIGTVLNHILET